MSDNDLRAFTAALLRLWLARDVRRAIAAVEAAE